MIETVTVLFTDLVDSTGLLAQHGPEATDLMRRQHFLMLRRALGDRGREVKNLGDGLMVVFSSAATAVDIAVAMQQAVARSGSAGVEPAGLRVGIAVGDAEADEHDYFGLPVVEAARLCARADGGEILATDLVRALAGGRGGHQFESVGALTLKGLDSPVAANRVVWAPAAEQPAPLPGRLRQAPAAGVHGRDAEQERVAQLVKEAMAGVRQVVFISGEAGIGKTTLCGLVARRVHADGAIVLYGRCDEDLAVPYRPWVEALSELVPRLSELELTPRTRGELARLLPGLGEPEQTDGDQYLLFAAVREVLAGCAPVVVVLDDLHWADAPSVRLLHHLIVNDDASALAVVATFREDAVAADSPLADVLAAAHRESGVERVPLRGLDDGALARLMEAAAGHALGADGLQLRDALLAETDGNPFFVVELLRHLAETGAIVQEPDGRWTASALLPRGGLPVSVREVIGRRVARLGPAAATCLATAAVIGRDFELGVLASVMERPEDEVLELVEAAVGASLVLELEPGRFSFAHALIEHAVYDTMGATRRGRLHGRVAQAIEMAAGSNLESRVGELAHHWSLTPGPDAEAKALYFMQAAGQRALRQVAPDDALQWFERARDLVDRPSAFSDPVMVDVLTGLGTAQRQTGAATHRATLLDATERALAIGDTARAVRAVLANSRGHASRAGGRDRERIEGLERTLAALGVAASPERARVLTVLAHELSWVDSERAERCADEALALAERLGDERLLLDVLVGHVRTTIRPDNVRTRLVKAERAVQIARDLDDPLSESLALAWVNMATMQLADLDRTLASFERGRALADRVREPTVLWFGEWSWFIEHIFEGDLDAAEEDIARSTRVGREMGQADADTMDWAQRLVLREMRGDLAELADEVGVVNEHAGGALRPIVSEVLSAVGRVDEARECYVADRASGFPCPTPLLWLAFMSSWAGTAALLDDPVGAAVLYGRLEPHADELVFTGLPAPYTVSQRLGELASTMSRYGQAEDWFSKAEAIARKVRAPYYLAQAHLGRGTMRTRRDGTTEAARADLEAALAIAKQHGFGQVARDSAARLEV